MRFQVTQVMDAIEQRLTTDVTGAQAVVDLGEVVRRVELDQGRPVNLVRIGMVVDALSRYLVDGGAMLYGVVERALLSEGGFTSKERMVLSRWADDGLIEAVGTVGDRPVEVADLTGLPLITLDGYPKLASRFRWLEEHPYRVLRLVPRSGAAVLMPSGGPSDDPDSDDPDSDDSDSDDPGSAGEPAVGRASLPEEAPEPATADDLAQVAAFSDRGAVPAARVRISQHRVRRAEPNLDHAELLTRRWQCREDDCPAFGEHRRIGQPVPRLRGTTPVCPRHGEPVTDAGLRPAAYPVSIVVDDLPRRRLVVRQGEPVTLGRADDDPDVVSVARWLHRAAAAWISPTQVRLEATDEGLVVTDLSARGTLVWRRAGPDQRGTTERLRRSAGTLSEWDSVELYTGIELVPGDRWPAAVHSREEPLSVLVDAPTAAFRDLRANSQPSPAPATTSA